MYNYNKVLLVGRVNRPPECRTTANGVPMVQFRVAVHKKLKPSNGLETTQDLTTVVRVKAWDRLADACAEMLCDGFPVLVEGELQEETWKTADGGTASALFVKAHNVSFLARRAFGGQDGEAVE